MISEKLRALLYIVISCSLALSGGACRSRGQSALTEVQPGPETRVSLAQFGLPADYRRFDDDDCTSHVIGYRFVVWLPQDLVAVGFNTSPSCRAHSVERVSGGLARIMVFDTKGNLKARRDISYDADGGDELVAPGEAGQGPGGTLLFRIEEAGSSKSGVLLLDGNLKDVVRIVRFLERADFFTHALSFQDGFTWTGPRTYDLLDGRQAGKTREVTRDWPAGTMDREVGSYGDAFMSCKQELKPGQWVDTNIVYGGAHRRCVLNVVGVHGDAWSAPLQDDQVAEIVGVRADGKAVGIVRAPKAADRLLMWQSSGAATALPWYPRGYDTKLVGAADGMGRYLGKGEICENDCQRSVTRWMIFDPNEQKPLVDRTTHENSPMALSLDGLHYASFEAGELRIYSLAGRN
jgi:hypothetical protein